jgi:hypothetical protein
VYVDNLVSQVSKILHEGVKYRHIALKMPENLRRVFYKYSKELSRELFSCGVRSLDSFLVWLGVRI